MASRPKLRNLQKYGTVYYTKMKTRVRHVKNMCHVSQTMSIEFLVKFYPILSVGHIEPNLEICKNMAH